MYPTRTDVRIANDFSQDRYVIKELSDMVREPDFDKAMGHFQNVSDMNAYFEKLLAIVKPSVGLTIPNSFSKYAFMSDTF